MPELKLISHHLCPYVQRARIVLDEKSIAHALEFIDLANKPDWFLAVSPLGKVPVLLVDGEPLFESAVIAEYLNEVSPGSLHPSDPLERARHRSWIAYASSTLDGIAGLYNASDRRAWEHRRATLTERFARLERALGDGPWFSGPSFSLVDAAYAPVFRYFEVLDGIDDFGFFGATPAVRAWRRSLAGRASVMAAAVPDYHARLADFLARRGSHLSRLMEARAAA